MVELVGLEVVVVIMVLVDLELLVKETTVETDKNLMVLRELAVAEVVQLQ